MKHVRLCAHVQEFSLRSAALQREIDLQAAKGEQLEALSDRLQQQLEASNKRCAELQVCL